MTSSTTACWFTTPGADRADRARQDRRTRRTRTRCRLGCRITPPGALPQHLDPRTVGPVPSLREAVRRCRRTVMRPPLIETGVTTQHIRVVPIPARAALAWRPGCSRRRERQQPPQEEGADRVGRLPGHQPKETVDVFGRGWPSRIRGRGLQLARRVPRRREAEGPVAHRPGRDDGTSHRSREGLRDAVRSAWPGGLARGLPDSSAPIRYELMWRVVRLHPAASSITRSHHKRDDPIRGPLGLQDRSGSTTCSWIRVGLATTTFSENSCHDQTAS